MARRVVREYVDDGADVVADAGPAWNPIPVLVSVVLVVLLVVLLWSPVSNWVNHTNHHGSVKVTYQNK